MIDTDQYEKYIEEIDNLEDLKEYCNELTRLVLYDVLFGEHEKHERFLLNLKTMKIMRKYKNRNE